MMTDDEAKEVPASPRTEAASLLSVILHVYVVKAEQETQAALIDSDTHLEWKECRGCVEAFVSK